MVRVRTPPEPKAEPMPYPTNWDVHQIPICSKCGLVVPYEYTKIVDEEGTREYYLAKEYMTDGTDGWHVECPVGGE